MLDIKFISKNPKLVKNNLKKRFQSDKTKLVDEVVKLYKEWKELKQQTDSLRAKRNKISEEINQLKKQGSLITDKVKEVKAIPDEIKLAEQKIFEIKNKINNILLQIPNILHKSVPIGKDESKNKPSKYFGKKTKFKFRARTHVELLEELNQVDFNRSAKIAGNGFYILKDKLALLNQALIRYAIDYLTKKGYILIEPPLMIRRKPYEAVLEVKEFNQQVYGIKDEDLYLIATSEYPLISMFINEIIKEEDLPIKLVGFSPCFRREIGSHGINEKGLWRTHQFYKVEQIIICKPKDSYKYYNEILKNSIELYKKLNIPIRQLEICSGDLGALKAKQADLEAYRPTTDNYGEVGSCSNLTDAQARRLNIRIINKKGNKYHAHTLNNTAIATSRAMVSIIENYQQEDGSIKIPKVLQKYTGFKKIDGGKNAKNKKNKRTSRKRNGRR